MVRDLLRRLIRPPARPAAPTPPPTPAVDFSLPARGDDPRPLEVDTPVPGSLLLDIREPGELAGGVASEAMLLPMDLVPHHLDRLPRDRAITVYCAAGSRSLGVAHWLRERGFDAVSLDGGMSALRVARVAMRVPEGSGSRRRMTARVEGVPVAEEIEVIEARPDHVLGRFMDAQGYWVLVEA